MSNTPTAYNHQARKRFGQNFLHDQQIIDRIIRAINPQPGQHLLEIGPGQGALTIPILEAAGALDVVEVDRDLALLLLDRLRSKPGFRLHQQDVLKFDLQEIDCQADHELRVVGNLPYNISTPLMFHLLAQRQKIRDMIFMLQWEVVARMIARPGEENYGRLSVMVQYHCQVERLFKVPPGAFHPQPKVDSAIVKMTPWRQLPNPARNEKLFAEVVRTAFNQRRKTLRNSLKSLISASALESLGLDLTQRPETLSTEDYVRISDLIDSQSESK
jgi:16S rRNA (adenine1518-N6/adenine1519-N6)-dimethyltransferase